MSDEERLIHLLQASLGVQLTTQQELAEEVLLREATRIYRNLNHQHAAPRYPYPGWELYLWKVVIDNQSSSIPDRLVVRMKKTAEIAGGWFLGTGDTTPPTFVHIEDWMPHLV